MFVSGRKSFGVLNRGTPGLASQPPARCWKKLHQSARVSRGARLFFECRFLPDDSEDQGGVETVLFRL